MPCAPLRSVLLPDANSLELRLSHPTPKECVEIWRSTSASWRDSLTVPVYLKESLYLTTVPLAKDGGMTDWVLVDKNLPPDHRSILCSCESFRKRALTSDPEGNVNDAIIHAIASVFCPPGQRSRGYASRMMRELAQVLRTWQSENYRCIGSILYSEIGKEYYAKRGWRPNLTNSHVEFQSTTTCHQLLAQLVPSEDLAELCHRDEVMIRKAMAIPAEGAETRMTVIPDLDHMLWHIDKEEFACKELINCLPVDEKKLHAEDNHKQLDYLKAVLEAAQAEAAEWRLDQVQLWDPSPAVRDMIVQSGIEHVLVDRQEDGIASGVWYDSSGEVEKAPHWLNNEYYSWC
ncbi:hypothetical protein BJ875DRAFT_521908 [Amylocarpus encephaloides]|uniref:LYC1 C-terminal domain-containing protein n=1 Tax=Amylocarpus encephaloides TaxID=45428 RepID=A0A9P8C111_9HELO|nr:hypothetical protein BJ875DRAFT_521908 [Amylocarpus encephaloides]